MGKLSDYVKKLFKPLVQTVKNPDTQQILEKNLDYFSGIETRLQNPDSFLSNKNQDVKFFDTMMLDDVISSTMELKKLLTLSIPYDIKPASEDEADIEKAEFVKDVLSKTIFPFGDILDNFLDAMIYGYKVGEIIWGIRDNKWVWENIKCKHSYFFDFDYDTYGNLETLFIGYYIGQQKKITGIDKINNKFMIFNYPYTVDGNYYGESDLSGIYQQYNQKFYVYKWRGMYLQGYGMPIPIVKYDKQAVSSSEYTDFTDMLDNWQDNMYIMLPSLRNQQTGELKSKFEIEFREVGSGKGGSGGSGGTPYDQTIEHLNTDIRRKLLIPDKLGFTKSDGGSYALGDIHFDIMKLVIKDLHNKLENFINPHIKRLIDFNFPNNEMYPMFKFQDITDAYDKDLLKILFDYKVVDPAESWIRSKTKIPEISQKEKEELEKKREEENERKIADQQNMVVSGNTNSGSMGNTKERDEDTDTKETAEKTKEVEKEADNKTEKMKNDPPFPFGKVGKQLAKFEDEFIPEYEKIYLEQIKYLVKQIQSKKIIENKDIKAIDSLRIKKGDLKDLLSSYYAKLYIYGKETAILDSQKKVKKTEDKYDFQTDEDMKWLDRTWVDKYLKEYKGLGKLTKDDISYLKQLRDSSFMIAGNTENDMTKQAFRVIKEGLSVGEDLKTIISKLEATLTSDMKKYATTIARTNQTDAFNNARMNLFRSDDVRPMITAYQYSAILDETTTDFCREHDGQIIEANDPQLGTIVPPNHYNCRSILIPIFGIDNETSGNYYQDYANNFEKFGEGVSFENSKPSKGFGG